jgi:hypothetical protein
MRSQSLHDLMSLVKFCNEENYFCPKGLLDKADVTNSTFQEQPLDISGQLDLKLRIGVSNHILSASIGMCSLLGFSEEEMKGRSVQILSGPETDLPLFLFAIKSVVFGGQRSTIPNLKIYSGNGQSHTLHLTCTAETICDHVYQLHFERIKCQTAVQDSGSVKAKKPNFRRSLEIRPVSVIGSRARYNFITGLQIHKRLLSMQDADQ